MEKTLAVVVSGRGCSALICHHSIRMASSLRKRLPLTHSNSLLNESCLNQRPIIAKSYLLYFMSLSKFQLIRALLRRMSRRADVSTSQHLCPLPVLPTNYGCFIPFGHIESALACVLFPVLLVQSASAKILTSSDKSESAIQRSESASMYPNRCSYITLCFFSRVMLLFSERTRELPHCAC